MRDARFTCPCCGHRTLSDRYAGGANSLSVMDAQANYARVGACEERFLGKVRPPNLAETRDPEWQDDGA